RSDCGKSGTGLEARCEHRYGSKAGGCPYTARQHNACNSANSGSYSSKACICNSSSAKGTCNNSERRKTEYYKPCCKRYKGNSKATGKNRSKTKSDKQKRYRNKK